MENEFLLLTSEKIAAAARKSQTYEKALVDASLRSDEYELKLLSQPFLKKCLY